MTKNDTMNEADVIEMFSKAEREKLRGCECKFEFYDHDERVRKKLRGVFLRFGLNSDEEGTFTTAIVKDTSGQLHNLPVDHVTFNEVGA